MKHGNRNLLLFAIALLLVGALVCHGRVFVSWKTAAQSTEAIEKSGGKIAYEAAVTVNGGAGYLTVFGFETPLAQTVRGMDALFGAGSLKYNGGTMAMGSVSSEGRVLKLMAITLGDESRTLVLKFEQSAAEAKASGERPAGHLLNAVPAYPGSAAAFFAKDDNTGMSAEISSSSDGTGAIHEFFDSSLTGAGWTAVTPRGTGNTGLMVFQKGSELCCVLVAANDNASSGSRITVLHKSMLMK